MSELRIRFRFKQKTNVLYEPEIIFQRPVIESRLKPSEPLEGFSLGLCQKPKLL